MSIQRLQGLSLIVLVLLVAGIVGYAVWPHHAHLAPASSTAIAAGPHTQAKHRLVNGKQADEFTVQLSTVEQQQLGLVTDFVRYNTDQKKSYVRMAATTALNPDTLAHVHPRFAGEAIDIRVRLGQRIKKGQTLAVLWSKDLGEKKSELIDARSQMNLTKDALDHLREGYSKGAIPQQAYRQAVRDYEAARIAYDRAYQTLVSWRLTKKEIDNIEHEKGEDWPRVIVQAPREGTVVEKNVVAGELVDPTMNLFVISDLSRLSVWASALEEDLLALHPGQEWTVTLQALPGRTFKGKIDVVGAVFDPTQHTVTVQGTIANRVPDEREQPLRAGMYATATVAIPPNATQVVVPTTALIDDGEHTYVYVQSRDDSSIFTRREVQIQERLADRTLLASGLMAGEKVVIRGSPELEQKAQAGE